MDAEASRLGARGQARRRHAATEHPGPVAVHRCRAAARPAARRWRGCRAACAGVVLRHDAHRTGRLWRAISHGSAGRGGWRWRWPGTGGWRPRCGAGLHLRGGRRPAGAPRRLPGLDEFGAWGRRRCGGRCARARCGFLSPAFPTVSHPGLAALGPCRWGLAVRGAGGRAGAPRGGGRELGAAASRLRGGGGDRARWRRLAVAPMTQCFGIAMPFALKRLRACDRRGNNSIGSGCPARWASSRRFGECRREDLGRAPPTPAGVPAI